MDFCHDKSLQTRDVFFPLVLQLDSLFYIGIIHIMSHFAGGTSAGILDLSVYIILCQTFQVVLQLEFIGI